MTLLRCLVNNHVIQNVINAEINNSGIRRADAAEISVAGKLIGLELGHEVRIIQDKISLDGMTALYSFERHVHEELNDNATLTSNQEITYSTGYAGHGITLNGNQNLQVPPVTWNLKRNFDMTIWVRLNNVNTEQTFISIFDNNTGIHCGIRNTGHLFIQFGSFKNNSRDIILQANKWYCIRFASEADGTISCHANLEKHFFRLGGRFWGGIDLTNPTSNFIIGGQSGSYVNGMIDIFRFRAGSNFTDSEHRHIVNNIEPASFTKFGGIIRDFEYTDKFTTELNCISHGAILNNSYAVYNTLQDVNLLEMLKTVIQDNTDLNVIIEDPTDIILNAPVTEGKVITIIRNFLEQTNYTFYTDSYKNLIFFLDNNRIIPGVFAHGYNCDVKQQGRSSADVYDNVFIQGHETTSRDAVTDRTIQFTRTQNQAWTNNTGLRLNHKIEIPNGSVLEQAAKAGIDVGNTISEIISIKIAQSVILAHSVIAGRQQTATVNVFGLLKNRIVGRSYVSSGGPTDNEYITTRVGDFRTVPSNQYSFSGSILRINPSYVWPTTTRHILIQQLRYDRDIYTVLAQHSVGAFGKYNYLEINYKFSGRKDFVQSQTDPNLLVVPHLIAKNTNTKIKNTKRFNIDYITNNEDKQKFLINYMQTHSKAKPIIIVETYYYGSSFRTGDVIHVRHKQIDIDGSYIIRSVKIEYPTGLVTLELSEYTPQFITQISRIQAELREVEGRAANYSENYTAVYFTEIPLKFKQVGGNL